MILKVITLALMILLAGCEASYKDIPSGSEYSNLLGKNFVLHEELLMHGITERPRYAPPVSYYVLTGRPGIGGPEVLSQEVLAKGTVLSVTRILECTNCLPKKVRATVVVSGKPVNQPVMIDVKLLQD